MKSVYVLAIITSMLVILSGCGPSTQSGVNKEYDMRMDVSGQSTVTLTIRLDAETQAATESGDAGAQQEIDPAIALGMQGSTTSAAAKGAEQLLEDIVSRVEAWQRTKDDHSDNSTDNSDNSTAAPTTTQPSAGGGSVDNPTSDTGGNSVGGNPLPVGLLMSVPCDKVMEYRDSDTATSVPQKKCLFTEVDTCNQMPERFTVVWRDAAGNTESLSVTDRCGIAMGSIEEGYRKYRYVDDKFPHPVAYAPRYFEAVTADVVIP